jgi:hypothetical protein
LRIPFWGVVVIIRIIKIAAPLVDPSSHIIEFEAVGVGSAYSLRTSFLKVVTREWPFGGMLVPPWIVFLL